MCRSMARNMSPASTAIITAIATVGYFKPLQLRELLDAPTPRSSLYPLPHDTQVVELAGRSHAPVLDLLYFLDDKS